MSYPGINRAHGELVDEVAAVTNPGFDPIPISVVSVTDQPGGQMVVFDERKFSAAEVAKRLRIAADFMDQAAKK